MDNPLPSPPPAPGSGSDLGAPPRDGWAVGAGRGADWWRAGWKLFTPAPWTWIAITVVAGVITLVLNQVPFIGPIAVTLLYPLLFAGVMVGARELDRGGELRFNHLFACFSDRAMPLVILALVMLAGWFVVWLVTVGALVGIVGLGTLGSLLAGDLADMGLGMLGTLGFGALVALLLALLLAAPLILASWFAPLLVLFRGDEPIAAMRTSFVACMRNMPPFLVYGLVGIVLAVVATIPFGLGWLVLMPVSAASVYAGYTDIFGSP